MFRIDSTEDFSRFSGRLFDWFSGSNPRFLVPMYHESAYLWYITFEGRFRGEYSGNSGGLFLLQDYLSEAVEGTDADSSGGGVRYHGFCGSFVRSCAIRSCAVRNTGRRRC